MQGHHAPCYIFPAHEIAIDIIKQFIAVNIAMVVGCRNRLGMIIKQPWTKRTDHEIICLKGLVNRRWLVHTASNGLKVVDRKCKRITAAVPSNHIKGMVAIMNIVKNTFLFGL